MHTFPSSVSWECPEAKIAQQEQAHPMPRYWFLMPFQKEPEPLEKWRILVLEQGIYKMSLEHRECQKARKCRNRKQSHKDESMPRDTGDNWRSSPEPGLVGLSKHQQQPLQAPKQRNNPPRLISDCNPKYKVSSHESVLVWMTEYVNKLEGIDDSIMQKGPGYCVNALPSRRWA